MLRGGAVLCHEPEPNHLSLYPTQTVSSRAGGGLSPSSRRCRVSRRATTENSHPSTKEVSSGFALRAPAIQPIRLAKLDEGKGSRRVCRPCVQSIDHR